MTRVGVAVSGGGHRASVWAAGLPTVLRELRPDPTVRLLWHAYVLAACNLHVLLPGYALPPLPTEEEFRELIG